MTVVSTDRAMSEIADADVVHYEVKQYIHAGPDLRHAFQMFSGERSRSGPDAHNRTRKSGSAKPCSSANGERALLFSDPHQRLFVLYS